MKNHVITLVETIHDVDPETKEPTEATVRTEIFAEKKSVWMREFYAAASFDLRPEIIFVIWQHDYNGQQQIEVTEGANLKQYQLIRAYEPNREEIELICSGPGPRPRTR